MNEIANTTEQNSVVALNSLAAQARMLTENIAMNMLQLGRVFTEAKRIIAHGSFAAWVQDNCGMSERYAQQFMQAYARYGESEKFASLGKSKLLKMLALPPGEEEQFVEAHDVSGMSAREVEEAVKAEREKWQERVNEAEKARAAAQVRIDELEKREPEIPEAVFHSMKEKDAIIAQQRVELENIAEQQRDILTEAGQLRTENASLKRDNEDQADMLKGMQEDLERAQRELLDAKSEIARGDAERAPADRLTAEAFTSAVRQFIGTCARLPHMRMSFATMGYAEKLEFDEALSTVEAWAAESRKALDTVISEGGVIS